MSAKKKGRRLGANAGTPQRTFREWMTQPAAAPPPPAAPAARPAAGPPATGPGVPLWAARKPTIDPAQYLPDLPGMWDYIRQVRRDPRFRPPMDLPLLPLAVPGDALSVALETARFFKIPEANIRAAADPWKDVLGPFLQTLEESVNIVKPRDIPGIVRFETAQDGSFGMIYREG